jgi:hypothetical protein
MSFNLEEINSPNMEVRRKARAAFGAEYGNQTVIIENTKSQIAQVPIIQHGFLSEFQVLNSLTALGFAQHALGMNVWNLLGIATGEKPTNEPSNIHQLAKEIAANLPELSPAEKEHLAVDATADAAKTAEKLKADKEAFGGENPAKGKSNVTPV